MILLAGCDLKTSGNEEKEAASQEITSTPINEAQTSNNAKFSLKYTTSSISKKSENCSGDDCTRVNVDYPKFDGNSKLNDAIKLKISEYLAEFVMGASETQTPESIASLFITSYEDFKKEFPEVEASWYINMNVIPLYQSKDFLSFKFNTESYGGGAHANTETHFVNFSPKGKILDRFSYFIRDKQQLTELAEIQFRKNNKLNESESLTAAGFNFDNDKFSLSENFGFDKKGMIFYYNSYDIASYAEGPSMLVVPFDQLKDILRVQ